jgi:hypothetical protein
MAHQANETNDNTFKKLYRIIRRDLLKKDPQDIEGFGARYTLSTFSIITPFCSLIALALGGPTAAAIGLFAGGSFMALSAARDLYSEHKKSMTKETVSADLVQASYADPSGKQTVLVGPTSAVNILRNTQMLIDEWADKHSTEGLSEKAMKRLQPYLADAYNAAAQVDVYSQTVRKGAVVSSKKLDSIQLLCNQFSLSAGMTQRVPFKQLAVKNLSAASQPAF